VYVAAWVLRVDAKQHGAKWAQYILVGVMALVALALVLSVVFGFFKTVITHYRDGLPLAAIFAAVAFLVASAASGTAVGWRAAVIAGAAGFFLGILLEV
jgi:hypothetical protein